MSLESYKKTIEAQKEREREYYPPSQSKEQENKHTQETEFVYVEGISRKKQTGCLVFFIIIGVLVIVASIKNPSENESRVLVKDFIVEKLNDHMRAEMNNDDNDGLKKLGAFLGITFSSKIMDYVTQINVTDYVLLSTFDCTIEIKEEQNTIVSGIIVFGKIIPLKSDMNNLRNAKEQQ